MTFHYYELIISWPWTAGLVYLGISFTWTVARTAAQTSDPQVISGV